MILHGFSFPVLSVLCGLRSADYVDLLDIASLLTRGSGKGQQPVSRNKT